MPRAARIAPGGVVFHFLNRGAGKNQLFFNDDDYRALERVIADYSNLPSEMWQLRPEVQAAY